MCQDYFFGGDDWMLEVCSDCEYNVDEYCIMFDDVLGFEDCVFKKEEEKWYDLWFVIDSNIDTVVYCFFVLSDLYL